MKADDKKPTCFRRSVLARPEGLEPLAFWSVARRSIQLSYGRISSAIAENGKYNSTVKRKMQVFSLLF